MKLNRKCELPAARHWTNDTLRRNGSAVLIILVLLACMAALLAANSTTLHLLKQDLKQIDERQQKKFAPGPRP